MSLSKIKIKLPKLLLKSMRRRKPGCSESNDANCNKGKMLIKSKSFLSNHTGLVLSHSFSNKKSRELWNPSQEGNYDKIDHVMKELVEEQGMQLVPADQEIPCRRGEFLGGKGSCRSVDAGKRLSFSDRFCKKIYKKTRYLFTKWRLSRTKSVKIDEDIGKDGTFVRCVSMNTKGKNTKFMQKKVVQQGEDSGNEEDKGSKDTELCKKKILMGEKCRPLNKSGTLQYDENGILLPEET